MIWLKRFIIYGGLALVITLLVFGGAGIETGNRLFHSGERDGAHRYFKTPQAAAARIGDLVTSEDWDELVTYYDLTTSSLNPNDLRDGSFFLTPRTEGGHRPPFEPGYTFREMLGTEFEDVFEVVVTRTDEEGIDHMQFFHLRRYPEGYRLLVERPAEEVNDGFE